MNRWRYLVIATIALVALSTSAQQTTTASTGQPHQANAAQVDQHMHGLTEKLDLTAEQQEKIRPVIQSFLEGQQKLMNDTSLSESERKDQIAALHANGMKQVRACLTDEQQKKLEELEQEHAAGHAN